MKKILFIAAWYPVRFDSMIGLFVKRHAEVVARSNKVFVLHVCDDSENKKNIEVEEFSENNVYQIIVYYKKVKHNIFFISHITKAILILYAFYKAIVIFRKHCLKPDIIHLHILTFRTGVLAWLIKIIFRIPFYITEHSSYYLPEKKAFRGHFWEFATRLIAKQSNGISVVSEKLKNGMILKGYNHNNFVIIRNVVPDIFFNASLNLIGDNHKIIFSNITCFDDNVKNISGIVRVIAKLKERNNNFLLYLVGDGPDRIKIEKLINELNLNDVIKTTGLLEGEELVKIYLMSAFTILFSHYETMAVVIAESLACGRPVIATRTGGIPELIDKMNGILIKPADEDELLNSILLMLNNYKHYNAMEIRQKAYQQFSAVIISKKFEDFYAT